jgi:hypothetical protein
MPAQMSAAVLHCCTHLATRFCRSAFSLMMGSVKPLLRFEISVLRRMISFWRSFVSPLQSHHSR